MSTELPCLPEWLCGFRCRVPALGHAENAAYCSALLPPWGFASLPSFPASHPERSQLEFGTTAVISTCL